MSAAPHGRRPWLTGALVAVNVAVFVAMLAAGAGLLRPDPLVHIAWGSNFGPLTLDGEGWRLGTAAFLHFGLLHLVFNMWALWASGGLVERLFGPARYAAIYAASGLVASLASVAWNPLVNSAGASGAIFGVLGAQLAFFLRARHGIPAEVIRAQRNSTLTFIAYAVIFGITVPGIDNAAHLGGLVTGIGLGWLLAAPPGRLASSAGGLAATVTAAALVAMLLAGGYRLAMHSAAAHREEQAYLRSWLWFADHEQQIVTQTNEVLAAARARQISDSEVAGRLETEVLPLWVEARSRIGGPQLPADSTLREEQARLLGYTRARAQGFRLMIEGIRENDRVKLERAVTLLEQAEQSMPRAADHR